MKRTAIDGGPAAPGGDLAASTPSVPLPPPALLERAKKLGAISAGPAMLGMAAGRIGMEPSGKALPVKRAKTVKAKRRKSRS